MKENNTNQKGNRVNRLIFDTETTGLDKPFCYDLGYVIIDEDGNVLKQAHYIIEQIWHNLPLFESAYYKEKRTLYINLMRTRKATLDKFGYIMQALARDIKNFEIAAAYAYNSNFDDKVFSFNCDWYKCINPLDNVQIYDIWGYASEAITNKKEFRDFCEAHERFTDSGNYSGSAETVYQFLTNNPDFVEQHMGLYDSQIEAQILVECIKRGLVWDNSYKVNKILNRVVTKPFYVKVDGKLIYEGDYVKKYIRNDKYYFTTEEGI